MKYIHVVLYMIVFITMTDKIDTWFLKMTPSNAISRSVPKGHVSHLNDLVPVSRGKTFWVKPAIDRIHFQEMGPYPKKVKAQQALHPLPRVLPKSRVVVQTPNSG